MNSATNENNEINAASAAVQFAASDLAYALRQADGVSKSWVLA
jgi:tRNA splicing endonuclease